jgi:hypothetical protein
MVAVEIDRGIFSWRVLHFTPRHIKSGLAVRKIETLMKAVS